MKPAFQPRIRRSANTYKIKAARKLKIPQIELRKGGDNPLPGGLANGVGNFLPDIPCTKWGCHWQEKRRREKIELYSNPTSLHNNELHYLLYQFMFTLKDRSVL